MKLKLVFATATSIGLLIGTGAVLAGAGNSEDTLQTGGNNTATINQANSTRGQSYLNQDGDQNNADVTQTSNSDSQYFTPNGNKFGKVGDYALQDGSSNTLTLTQDFIGNNGNEVGTGGVGFEQHGNGNSATITQNGSRNLSLEIVQTDGNSLNVTQGRAGYESDYAYNRIDSIQQTNTGDVANTATITQQGVVGAGQLNRIGTVIQNGSADQATISQTGNRNAIDTVSQANGTGNIASFSVTGNYNGSDGLNALNEQALGAFGTFGTPAARGFAAANGAAQGSLVQSGTSNQINFAITGDNNLFGFAQTGDANTVDGSISGNSNQLAVTQKVNAGTGHAEGTVNIANDSNDVSVSQTISGGSRLAVASITVSGSNNNLNVSQGQIGNGRDSVVDVSITGDRNNSVSGFSVGGDAYDVLNFSRRLAGSGQISQGGSGNQLTDTVTGDDNLFAFYQSGTGNTITASTTDNGNQAAVVQTGSSNTANFTQNGANNNVGVSQ